jgi:hypothetical protein
MTKLPIGSTGFISRDVRSGAPTLRRLTKNEMDRNFSPLGMAIKQAMITSVQAIEHRFDSLPIPVRYRASGAIDAWTSMRRLAGRDGATFSAALADPCGGVMGLGRNLSDLIRHCLGDPPPDESDYEFANIYTRSAISQAFWLRGGALYEPTLALHRLLEASDISSDVPLSLLSLPAPAICIVPEPALRDRNDGFEAVVIFEHLSPVSPDEYARHFTICVWPHENLPQPLLEVQTLTLFAGDTSQTIDDVIDQLSLRHGLEDEASTLWRRVLDYVVKVLLYLSLDVAPVVHERSYSTAPRNFPALGKRRRLERLQEIEALYDRYIVGPAMLPAQSDTSASDEGLDHEVRAHWRRGHFRMQAHGPAAAQRKLIFIMPVLVRADRLSLDAAP